MILWIGFCLREDFRIYCCRMLTLAGGMMRNIGACCSKLRLCFCFIHFCAACEGIVVGGGIIGDRRIIDEGAQTY